VLPLERTINKWRTHFFGVTLGLKVPIACLATTYSRHVKKKEPEIKPLFSNMDEVTYGSMRI